MRPSPTASAADQETQLEDTSADRVRLGDSQQRGAPPGGRPLTLLGRLALWHPQTWDDDRRRTILNELFYEDAEWRPFLGRFSVLLVLSTMIAALGLVADSVAVVIGAMLVAPLMTPILGVAGAAVHGQPRRLLVSGLVLMIGTAAAVATGWLVSSGMPGEITADELTGELLARTSPSLIDLGIAVAAGLAGGYVLTHPRAGSSLPGVAIAVALVPPLATVGITLQIGAISSSLGALLLYTTNMVAIILSAMIVMLITGFVPPEVRRLVRTRVRLGLVLAALAVAAVTVPLTAHTIDVAADQRFSRAVLAAIDEWDPQARVVQVDSDTSPSRATVNVVMAASHEPAPAWRLAELLAAAATTPIDVSVEYRQEHHDEATAG
jgi:uncharacterized hydrophobic protein (TIGR00271 family)